MSGYDELHRLGLKLKFAYSLVGLIVGLACILVGLILGIYGAAGHTSWTASVFGLSTNLNDAAPGVVVFVVGIFIVFITRFKIKDTVVQKVEHPRAEIQPDVTPDLKRGGGGDTEKFTRSIQYKPASAAPPRSR